TSKPEWTASTKRETGRRWDLKVRPLPATAYGDAPATKGGSVRGQQSVFRFVQDWAVSHGRKHQARMQPCLVPVGPRRKRHSPHAGRTEPSLHGHQVCP